MKNIIFNQKDNEIEVLEPTIVTIKKEVPELKTPEPDDNILRIDFLYYASPIYINGGWVQIHPSTFIRPVGSQTKYKLIGTVNIPKNPVKHYFKTQRDMLFYSLLFPLVPKDVTHIDIIEMESNLGTWFNFYNVPMQTVLNSVIVVNSSPFDI
jgi:hypothetical protein